MQILTLKAILSACCCIQHGEGWQIPWAAHEKWRLSSRGHLRAFPKWVSIICETSRKNEMEFQNSLTLNKNILWQCYMKWKLTCLTVILTCSSHPQQTANIHAHSVPKARADNQMWSRLWLSLLTQQGWGEASFLGIQLISSPLDNPSKSNSSIPYPSGMFWERISSIDWWKAH